MITREKIEEFLTKQEALCREYGLILDPATGGVLLCGKEDAEAGYATEKEAEEALTDVFANARDGIDRVLDYIDRKDD